MKKLLLTGSEGYIGTNFQKLYNNQYDIVCVDKKLQTYTEYFVDFEDIDAIIHLSAISGIADCEKDYKQTIIDNISGTLHLMKASWAYQIPLLFASSQAAKTPESGLYALTKKIGEVEAQRYNDIDGKLTCLRFSNVFGGKDYLQTKSSVVSKFINAKHNKQPLQVNGDGTQTRDFIHVEELCKALHWFLSNHHSETIYDIGTGIERTILDLAKMISPEFECVDSPLVGVKSSIADIELLKKSGLVLDDRLEEYIKQKG